MPRSGKEMRHSLRQAALELYRDKGYEQTTTAQIAARAGVTERTFFRHFSDKREVLFEEETLRTALAAGMAAAPTSLAPLEALHRAFGSIEEVLAENRDSADAGRDIIAATPALQERALAKAATLANDLAAALRLRGVDERLAILAAQVAIAASNRAIAAWRDDPSHRFTTHLDRAFADLRSLLRGG